MIKIPKTTTINKDNEKNIIYPVTISDKILKDGENLINFIKKIPVGKKIFISASQIPSPNVRYWIRKSTWKNITNKSDCICKKMRAGVWENRRYGITVGTRMCECVYFPDIEFCKMGGEYGYLISKNIKNTGVWNTNTYYFKPDYCKPIEFESLK